MVEGARLESVFRGNSNVGSNPTLSASLFALESKQSASVLLPLDARWRLGLAQVRWPTGNLPEVVGCGVASYETATLRALIREYLFIAVFSRVR